jgi:hypothetical protein
MSEQFMITSKRNDISLSDITQSSDVKISTVGTALLKVRTGSKLTHYTAQCVQNKRAYKRVSSLAIERLSQAQCTNIISDNNNLSQYTPNIVLVWLTFLHRIQEVLGSNLVPETAYPEFFVVFLTSPSQFIIYISAFIGHYVMRVTEKASLNELQTN